MENDKMALPGENKETKIEEFKFTVPEFKVSGIFLSHMVIQRDKEINVWGFSSLEGNVIYGEFLGEQTQSTCINGEWNLRFTAHSYDNIKHEMIITDKFNHRVVFDDSIS